MGENLGRGVPARLGEWRAGVGRPGAAHWPARDGRSLCGRVRVPVVLGVEYPARPCRVCQRILLRGVLSRWSPDVEWVRGMTAVCMTVLRVEGAEWLRSRLLVDAGQPLSRVLVLLRALGLYTVGTVVSD